MEREHPKHWPLNDGCWPLEHFAAGEPSPLPVDPEKALHVAVQHWDVENPLHWTLDMVFDEDHSRARSEYAPENLAIVRHFAFNMIRRDKVTTGGMSRKKKSMTWNTEKLLQALRAA